MNGLEIPEGAGVGCRMRAAREVVRPKLSGREFDRLAGRPENLATQIEGNPDANPTVSTLRAYAAVIGASVEWLATGGGEQPTTEQINAAVAKARAATVQPAA